MKPFQERIDCLHGEVEIVMRNVTTGEIRHIRSNLVVDAAYTNLASLFSGDLVNRAVSKIYPGKGTDVPAAGDTTITFLTSHVFFPVTATFPSSITGVTFSAVWAAGEVDVDPVTELGLFFANNQLCARVLFDSMTKSASWSWAISWTLQYPV